MFGIGKSATHRTYINASKIIIAIIRILAVKVTELDLYMETFFVIFVFFFSFASTFQYWINVFIVCIDVVDVVFSVENLFKCQLRMQCIRYLVQRQHNLIKQIHMNGL